MSPARSLWSARCRLATVAALCASAPALHAQQVHGSRPGDHVLVVTRTVQPRIAYRGVELADNPVRMQATVFPGRVFHHTVDDSLERLLGDSELVQVGSAGVGGGATIRALLADGLDLRSGQSSGVRAMAADGGAAGMAPMGMAASSGGAVSAATRGLGDTIQSSLVPALGTAAGGGR